MKITLSELAKLPQEEQVAAMRELVRAARRPVTPETLKKIDDEIADFERTHGFDSATMKQKLRTGEIRETFEVCNWLMTLNLRNRLRKKLP